MTWSCLHFQLIPNISYDVHNYNTFEGQNRVVAYNNLSCANRYMVLLLTCPWSPKSSASVDNLCTRESALLTLIVDMAVELSLAAVRRALNRILEQHC